MTAAKTNIGKTMNKICPHWYRELPNDGDNVMMDVTKREVCRICGQHRIHAKVPEPHPSRSKEELVKSFQLLGLDFVVDEWLPYEESEL